MNNKSEKTIEKCIFIQEIVLDEAPKDMYDYIKTYLKNIENRCIVHRKKCNEEKKLNGKSIN